MSPFRRLSGLAVRSLRLLRLLCSMCSLYSPGCLLSTSLTPVRFLTYASSLFLFALSKLYKLSKFSKLALSLSLSLSRSPSLPSLSIASLLFVSPLWVDNRQAANAQDRGHSGDRGSPPAIHRIGSPMCPITTPFQSCAAHHSSLCRRSVVCLGSFSALSVLCAL